MRSRIRAFIEAILEEELAVALGAILQKCEGLKADLGLDVEKLSDAYKTEIFDKLDPASYGM